MTGKLALDEPLGVNLDIRSSVRQRPANSGWRVRHVPIFSDQRFLAYTRC
jgi:hypothetical protein